MTFLLENFSFTFNLNNVITRQRLPSVFFIFEEVLPSQMEKVFSKNLIKIQVKSSLISFEDFQKRWNIITQYRIFFIFIVKLFSKLRDMILNIHEGGTGKKSLNIKLFRVQKETISKFWNMHENF